jgi:hypothetical protein
MMDQAAKIAALYVRLVEGRQREAALMRVPLTARERRALNDEIRTAERALRKIGAPIPASALQRAAAALRFGRS